MKPSPAPILLVATLGLLAFLAGVLGHFGWRASALCNFGASNLVSDKVYRTTAEADFRDGFVVMDQGTGYDGQYYFFIACDPFARHTEGRYRSPYYYQRILHPLLAWALAGGEPGRIPLAMALVTGLGILIGTGSLLALMPGARWWALAYALALGHLYGLQFGIGGPALSLGLSVAGFLAWTRGKGAFAALLLALAFLARESAVLVLVPLVIASVLQRRRRDAVLLALSVLPFALWECYLHGRLGGWGVATSGGHVTLPFLGFLRRACMTTGSGVDFGASLGGMANNAVLLAFLAYAAWTALDAGRHLLGDRKSPAAWLYAVHVGFFCCLTAGQLVDLNGASRPFLPVLPFMVLCRAGKPGSRRILLAGLAFSLAMLLKVLLAHPAYHLWAA